MTARILVAGVGNIFLGDDGFGPEVARRLAATRPADTDVRVVDYGIRGMHLAYDVLAGFEALILLDAVPGADDDALPGTVTVLEVGPDDLGHGELDAHGMDPVAVFASIGTLGGDLPPTFVVGCCPASLDEGIGLSEPVEAAVDEAVRVSSELVDHLLATAPAKAR